MVGFWQAIKILEHGGLASTEEGVCCFCGSTENVTFEPDPFAEEIEHDSTPVWECAKCREESARDI